MNVEQIWTDESFQEMGWHDSYIHAISFPKEDLKLKFDIDYIFKWVLDDGDGQYKFWVSPCILVFHNVLHLEINLNFQNEVGLDIQSINRLNLGVYPNGKDTKWNYSIITNKGVMTFESSGYKQIIKKQPILSQSQILMRGDWE